MLQTIFLLIGLLAGHVADPGQPCENGPCPEIPHRPVIAWTAPQSLRADEIRLWSRGERRPGQPGENVIVTWRQVTYEPLVIAPAPERLLVLRLRSAPR